MIRTQWINNEYVKADVGLEEVLKLFPLAYR